MFKLVGQGQVNLADAAAHARELWDGLRRDREAGGTTDLDLWCAGGRRVPAHRGLLCRLSPRLAAVLAAAGGCGYCPAAAAPAGVTLAEVDAADASAALELLYSGAAAVSGPEARGRVSEVLRLLGVDISLVEGPAPPPEERDAGICTVARVASAAGPPDAGTWITLVIRERDEEVATAAHGSGKEAPPVPAEGQPEVPATVGQEPDGTPEEDETSAAGNSTSPAAEPAADDDEGISPAANDSNSTPESPGESGGGDPGKAARRSTTRLRKRKTYDQREYDTTGLDEVLAATTSHFAAAGAAEQEEDTDVQVDDDEEEDGGAREVDMFVDPADGRKKGRCARCQVVMPVNGGCLRKHLDKCRAGNGGRPSSESAGGTSNGGHDGEDEEEEDEDDEDWVEEAIGDIVDNVRGDHSDDESSGDGGIGGRRRSGRALSKRKCPKCHRSMPTNWFHRHVYTCGGLPAFPPGGVMAKEPCPKCGESFHIFGGWLHAHAKLCRGSGTVGKQQEASPAAADGPVAYTCRFCGRTFTRPQAHVYGGHLRTCKARIALQEKGTLPSPPAATGNASTSKDVRSKRRRTENNNTPKADAAMAEADVEKPATRSNRSEPARAEAKVVSPAPAAAAITTPTKFSCFFCGKKCFKRNEIRQHMITHYRQEIRQHYLQQQGDDEDGPLSPKCPEPGCGYKVPDGDHSRILDRLITHLGLTHRKILNFMPEGYATILFVDPRTSVKATPPAGTAAADDDQVGEGGRVTNEKSATLPVVDEAADPAAGTTAADDDEAEEGARVINKEFAAVATSAVMDEVADPGPAAVAAPGSPAAAATSRSHPCPRCPKSFARLFRLRSHLYSHFAPDVAREVAGTAWGAVGPEDRDCGLCPSRGFPTHMHLVHHVAFVHGALAAILPEDARAAYGRGDDINSSRRKAAAAVTNTGNIDKEGGGDGMEEAENPFDPPVLTVQKSNSTLRFCTLPSQAAAAAVGQHRGRPSREELTCPDCRRVLPTRLDLADHVAREDCAGLNVDRVADDDEDEFDWEGDFGGFGDDAADDGSRRRAAASRALELAVAGDDGCDEPAADVPGGGDAGVPGFGVK